MSFPWENVKDRNSLRERAEEVVKELCYKAEMMYGVSLPTTPRIVITSARRYYARIVFKVTYTIRVNNIFIDFYRADPITADNVLKFVLAHEIGHYVQMKKYGRMGFIASEPLALEEEANEIAESLTGISYDDFNSMALELHKKVGTRVIPFRI